MKIVILEPLFVSDDFIKRSADDLISAGHDILIFSDRTEDEMENIKRGEGAEIIVTGNLPISEKMIAAWPELKFLPVAFTGLDHIALKACKERGILVVNAQGYAKEAVAELSIGLMLSVLRNIIPCDAVARAGKTRAGLVGSLLRGKTIGIVGTGEIGIRTAELCRAFGCEVLGYSRREKESALKVGLKYVSLETLMEKSDVVSLHLPLTEETEGLIGKEMIDRMKKTSILINVARGGVLDSLALAHALNENQISGAGIDVFETEPPLDVAHPLLHSKNTVVAPHVAFASRESFELRVEIVLENIRKWL